MKNQKICIIGDGLAGLTTALVLKNLDLDIDLFYKKKLKLKKDNRTTAISPSNYKFFKEELNIKNASHFWGCKQVELFYEKDKKIINFLNLSEKNKNLMYIFKNHKFRDLLLTKIKKEKRIRFINSKSINLNSKESSIKHNNKIFFYDLIILCAGRESDLYEEINIKRSISRDYKEIAITGPVTHNSKIVNSKQFFLKKGPLAILPTKKNEFSFVWSVDKKFYDDNLLILKSEIKKKFKETMKLNLKSELKEINSFPLQLNLKTRYSKKNVLVLGEGIHTIHPIAGQGFNLVIRDIIKLHDLIKKNIRLGLQIKNSLLLKNFYQLRKPENLLFGLGVDLTNNFFKDIKILNPIKDLFLKNIKNNDSVKSIAKKVSDTGIFI